MLRLIMRTPRGKLRFRLIWLTVLTATLLMATGVEPNVRVQRTSFAYPLLRSRLLELMGKLLLLFFFGDV